MCLECFVALMCKELMRLGMRELRTTAEVDEAVTKTSGTIVLAVNSVWGCAADKAGPWIAMALRHAMTPDLSVTVFAGPTSRHRARAAISPAICRRCPTSRCCETGSFRA